MTDAPRRRWVPVLTRWVMPALAGLGVALGQAPWGQWPLAVAGLGLLSALVLKARGPRTAFSLGWVSGAACFGLALVWIIEPFLVEPDRHGWMAPFALLLMAGGLGLLWGLAAALAVWLAPGQGARPWVLVLSLLGFEALRGQLFTGFPWAMVGHVWIGTPVAQLAALSGALGLSALALALGATLATAWWRWRQTRRTRALLVLALGGAALASAWVWGAARLAEPAVPDRDLRLRLVQPNAPQHLKWDWDHAEGFFWRHIDLTAAPAADGRAPDLVIWSETAVPFFLDNPGDGLRLAAEAAGGAPLVLGIQRREPGASGAGPRYFNSLAVLDPNGAARATYDKHHLVPFGEYMPVLGRFADSLGAGWAGGLASQALAGYSAGPGPVLLDLGEAGRVLPLICYEAIFPRNLRTTERPDWLLQITNDAWFGQRTGPFQHLAQARLRAIEQGLPMVRVANTGVSAVIDARGVIRAELGMDVEGALDADLPGARTAPPYARSGDLPWYLSLALALTALMVLKQHRRKRLTPPS